MSENGASLRASGWTFDGQAGGTHWTGQRYEQTEMVLDEMKVRWRKMGSKAILTQQAELNDMANCRR